MVCRIGQTFPQRLTLPLFWLDRKTFGSLRKVVKDDQNMLSSWQFAQYISISSNPAHDPFPSFLVDYFSFYGIFRIQQYTSVHRQVFCFHQNGQLYSKHDKTLTQFVFG